MPFDDKKYNWGDDTFSWHLLEPLLNAYLDADGKELPERVYEGAHKLAVEAGRHFDQLWETIDALQSRVDQLEHNAPAIDARTARDKWCYEAVCDTGRKLTEIVPELRKLCSENDWPDTLRGPNSLKKAAASYAAKNGLPDPPRRRG